MDELHAAGALDRAPDLGTYNKLVNVYSALGQFEAAEEVRMPIPTIAAASALLAPRFSLLPPYYACSFFLFSMFGQPQVLQRMESEGVVPDHTSYRKLIQKYAEMTAVAPEEDELSMTAADLEEMKEMYADEEGEERMERVASEPAEKVPTKAHCRAEAERLFIAMTNRGEEGRTFRRTTPISRPRHT
jgi:hypothetical protein